MIQASQLFRLCLVIVTPQFGSTQFNTICVYCSCKLYCLSAEPHWQNMVILNNKTPTGHTHPVAMGDQLEVAPSRNSVGGFARPSAVIG